MTPIWTKTLDGLVEELTYRGLRRVAVERTDTTLTLRLGAGCSVSAYPQPTATEEEIVADLLSDMFTFVVDNVRDLDISYYRLGEHTTFGHDDFEVMLLDAPECFAKWARNRAVDGKVHLSADEWLEVTRAVRTMTGTGVEWAPPGGSLKAIIAGIEIHVSGGAT